MQAVDTLMKEKFPRYGRKGSRILMPLRLESMHHELQRRLANADGGAGGREKKGGGARRRRKRSKKRRKGARRGKASKLPALDKDGDGKVSLG